ncbi:MAG: alpha/beta hydrolase [Rhodospirillales bacterium]|nr:alpha/beta hydrolase [Rhodospirillales bacterium]
MARTSRFPANGRVNTVGAHDLYIERGSGPAVVFGHGTSMDATMFAPQLDHLAERGYRAIACNSRVLTAEPEAHTLGDLVKDCRALLDDLDIGKCVLAGMSVGGFMALEFALAHPERLHGLIVIAATSLGYTAEEREQYHREFGKLDVDGMLPRAFAEWTAPYCFGATTLAHNRPLVDHWIERWTATIPARAVLYQGRSWIDKEDITQRLATVPVPAPVIHGEEDVPIPIERALPMVDALPDATFTHIPGAGHSVNLEAPAAVNAAIARFLGRLDLS